MRIETNRNLRDDLINDIKANLVKFPHRSIRDIIRQTLRETNRIPNHTIIESLVQEIERSS